MKPAETVDGKQTTEASEDAQAAGPSAIATATARLSNTTGVGAISLSRS